MDDAELSGAVAAEQRLLQPTVRADRAAVSELLDDDFTEIGQTGAEWTRSAVIDALVAGASGARAVTASDWAVRQVGPDLALVAYETHDGGIRVRRTTLWRRYDDTWRAVAHQATRVVN